MTRVIYVNGRYLPYSQAGVHAEDRGFQFGDAVYEVCEVKDGRLIDETRHLARLERSLGELSMRAPMPPASLSRVMRETIRRNRVRNGLVYLQVSRGAGPREAAVRVAWLAERMRALRTSGVAVKEPDRDRAIQSW